MRLALLLVVLAGCSAGPPSVDASAAPSPARGGTVAEGALFLIGGGTRTDELLDRLIAEAGLAPGRGYVVILPMASAEPDSAITWSGADFVRRGLTVVGYNLRAGEALAASRLDSLRRAPLIYLAGGDQARFMHAVGGTPVAGAVADAYRSGAVVAGTSAGAAVMSARMLTGRQRLHADYAPTYGSLEADNLDLAPGLGLLDAHVLVDQHFVVRSRYNRLLTAVIEHPEMLGVGIDESTAVLVRGRRAEVVGAAQAVVVRNPDRSAARHRGRLGARGLRVDVVLPGESFSLD